jgi:hypothetical protein
MTNRKLTKEYIIQYLKKYYVAAKDIPKSKDNTHPFCGKSVKNIFGSWNNALEASGIPIRMNPPREVNCKQCGLLFIKKVKEIKKSKNNFCCNSCAATYNNKNRKTGIRISKLELFLQQNLQGYDFQYNNREVCEGLELDIFIPSLCLAFEINGIVHYQAIYGEDKFNKIVEKDFLKAKRCIDKGIKLIVIKDESPRFNETYANQIMLEIYNQIHKHIFKNVLMDID